MSNRGKVLAQRDNRFFLGTAQWLGYELFCVEFSFELSEGFELLIPALFQHLGD